LAWADEMGLWHHEVIAVNEITEARLANGVSTKEGQLLKIDPLSARIAPFAQPSTIHLVCSDASHENKEVRSALKAKQLNPGWVKMMMSNTNLHQSGTKRYAIDALLNACEVPGTSPPENQIEWSFHRPYERESPPLDPGSPGSPSVVPSSPPVPTSPLPPDTVIKAAPKEGEPGYVLPPLLRPRQVHPTKATRLGLKEPPPKKRKNTDHLFCHHCGTKDTPEWRRGPDGRKSLCNACGLHYSKTIKKETLVTSRSRGANLDVLLNPVV